MSDIGKDDCIILNKCIQGLVQAVRQYYKTSVKIVNNLRFIGGNVDPFLYIKKSAKGIVYIALYDIKAIDNAIVALRNNELVLKVMFKQQGSSTKLQSKLLII